MYLHDNELYCPKCGYVPTKVRKDTIYVQDPWVHFWNQRAKAKGRKWCVGGVPHAYIGTGRYEMNLTTSEFNFRMRS